MPSLFANHTEYAKRSRMIGHACRHRRTCDQLPVVVNRAALVLDCDDDLERALCSLFGQRFFRSFSFCSVMAPVPGWSVIAPPQSVITPSPFVLRPKEKLSMCGLYREEYAANKYRQDSRIGRSGIDAPEDTFQHAGTLTLLGGSVLALNLTPREWE